MIRLYLPCLYTFSFNRKGLDGVAYFLEYCIALLVLVLLFGEGLEDILLFLFALLIYMTLYETGYLENNVKAIQKELHPTLRHTEKELQFLEENYRKIINFRYAFVGVMTLFMALWVDIAPFASLLLLSRAVFYLYNMKFREGALHRVLFMVLRFLRYVTPVWFLGAPALVFAAIVSTVNLINNFAWYDRWGVHLPRFFGTKLFDALVYGSVAYTFYITEESLFAYLFFYMAIMKLLLFIVVLWQKRVFENV